MQKSMVVSVAVLPVILLFRNVTPMAGDGLLYHINFSVTKATNNEDKLGSLLNRVFLYRP
jgi:hypothetical protein